MCGIYTQWNITHLKKDNRLLNRNESRGYNANEVTKQEKEKELMVSLISDI